MNNHSMIVEKESFFKKVINKIKTFFKFESENVIDLKDDEEISEKNTKNNFSESLKVEVDTQIYALKVKLENGEIKAIDLTDEQIDRLQEIYDKEIKEKKLKLEKLKKGA